MIYTANASQLLHVRGNSSSSWQAPAYQGRYSTQQPRVGAMLFPTLLDINWGQQVISSITMRMYFDGSGGSFAKTLGLYRGTRTGGISGTGGSMRGAYIGAVPISDAYRGTRTAVLSAGNNASAYANMVAWLQSMATNTLVIYVDEGLWSDHEYSYNYCRITSASLIIDYEPAGSDGTLDKTAVDAGGTVTLSITPPEGLGGVITHDVVWAFGAHTQTAVLGEGILTTSLAVPLAWLDAIPNSVAGQASCTLTTYLDDEERGSKTIPFTVRAPQGAAPTYTASVVPAGQVTAGYYQYLSAAHASITNAVAQYGATVVAYSITAPGGLGSAAAAEYTTPAFPAAGEHVFTFAVTDSRGLTASKAVSVTVGAVGLPTITTFGVQRYSIIEGDETGYVATDYGDHVWISITAAIDTANGHNTGSAYIEYGPVGGEKTQVQVALTGGAVQVANDRSIIQGEISPGSAYEFTLHISDLANSTQQFYSISRGTCVLHGAGGGYGLGVGRFATGATAGNPLFACAWPAQFDQGVDVAGAVGVGGMLTVQGAINAAGGISNTVQYASDEVDTGNTWIDGRRIYAKLITHTMASATSVTITYDFAGVELAWVDASTSFFVAKDNTRTINHVGYVASDGARIFMAQLRPERNQILLTTNNPGTIYVRLLYTKTDAAMSSPASISRLPGETAAVVQALGNRVGELERQAVDGAANHGG